MSVTVRVFTRDDAGGVSRLWREAFPDDPPRNEPEVIIERKLARDPDLFWVAERDGAVVGAVVAGYDGYRAWIYHLAVASHSRGLGIGTALLEAAVAGVHAAGARKVNLQIRADNEGVKGFYAASGFELDTALSMGRILPEAL